jgi:hypothetical protein
MEIQGIQDLEEHLAQLEFLDPDLLGLLDLQDLEDLQVHQVEL